MCETVFTASHVAIVNVPFDFLLWMQQPDRCALFLRPAFQYFYTAEYFCFVCSTCCCGADCEGYQPFCAILP